MKVKYSKMTSTEVLYQAQHGNKKFSAEELADYVLDLEKNLNRTFDKLHSPQYSGVQVTVMFRREPEKLIGELIARGGDLSIERDKVIRHFQDKYKQSLAEILKEFRKYPVRLGIEISVVGFKDSIAQTVDTCDLVEAK